MLENDQENIIGILLSQYFMLAWIVAISRNKEIAIYRPNSNSFLILCCLFQELWNLLVEQEKEKKEKRLQTIKSFLQSEHFCSAAKLCDCLVKQISRFVNLEM